MNHHFSGCMPIFSQFFYFKTILPLFIELNDQNFYAYIWFRKNPKKIIFSNYITKNIF